MASGKVKQNRRPWVPDQVFCCISISPNLAAEEREEAGWIWEPHLRNSLSLLHHKHCVCLVYSLCQSDIGPRSTFPLQASVSPLSLPIRPSKSSSKPQLPTPPLTFLARRKQLSLTPGTVVNSTGARRSWSYMLLTPVISPTRQGQLWKAGTGT